MSFPVVLLGIIAGYVLVRSAFTGGIGELTDPREVFLSYFTGLKAKPKQFGGSTSIELTQTPAREAKAKKPKKGSATAIKAKAAPKAKATVLWAQVHSRFPKLTFLGIVRDPSRGLNNCANPPSAGCGYSQHNYGNALDIGVGTDKVKSGDDCVRWLKANRDKLSIRNILWRGVANHYPGHIHVDFNPQYCGDPPGKKC